MNRKVFTSLFLKENSQRGISLLITLFVMAIALSIVLGVSVIILSELQVIRGVGYSVVAFYSADTGVEKTLYYDRKAVQLDWARGICNICTSCTNCINCVIETGTDCEPETCTDCQITYETLLGNKSFRVTTTVAVGGDVIQSYGSYLGVTRAIELSGSIGSGVVINPGPTITNASAVPRSVAEGVEVDIIADIIDVNGLNPNTLIARVQSPDDNDLASLVLENISGDTYRGSWTGPVGVYYVDLSACDSLGNCSQSNNI